MSKELENLTAEILADKHDLWQDDYEAGLVTEADKPTLGDVLSDLRDQVSLGDNFVDHGHVLGRRLTREIREHAVEWGFAIPLNRTAVVTCTLARRILWTTKGVHYEYNPDYNAN